MGEYSMGRLGIFKGIVQQNFQFFLLPEIGVGLLV
jgi:hypothetical protein